MSDGEDQITWFDERIGRSKEGFVVIKFGDVFLCLSEEQIHANHRDAIRLKWDLEIAERQINAREPAKWIEEAVTELEARGDQSDAAKNIGHSQAYRDAAGVVKRYFKANPRR